MTWFRCNGGNGGSPTPAPKLIPLSIADGVIRTQSGVRTTTKNGYKINSTLTSKNSSLGNICIPIVMPGDTNVIVVKYDLVGLSYFDSGYTPTIFCSDTQLTRPDISSSTYGNVTLLMENLASGESDRGHMAFIVVPSSASFFNIFFGTSGFENIEIFAFNSKADGESYIYNIDRVAFNTGYIHKATTQIVFKAIAEPLAGVNSNYGHCFGARNSNFRANALGFFSRNGGNRFAFYRTNHERPGDYLAQDTSSSPIPYVPCVYTVYQKKISWQAENGSAVRSIEASNSTVDDGVSALALFASNNATSADTFTAADFGFMQLYWFEIYENDVLLHRFVPAYNNNQWCLYDEVEEDYIYDVANNGASVRGWLAS